MNLEKFSVNKELEKLFRPRREVRDKLYKLALNEIKLIEELNIRELNQSLELVSEVDKYSSQQTQKFS